MSSDSGSGSEFIDYARYLEIRVRELEMEVAHLRSLITKYKEELEYYKGQVEKLLAPPLIEAILLDVLPDGRAVVKSSTGPTLIVHVMNGIDRSKLKPG